MSIILLRVILLVLIFGTSQQLAYADDATDPANRARALYYYVTGPPAGTGYPPGHTGPATGLLTYFNQIIYDAAVAEGFSNLNIESCSEVPNSGFMAMPSHSLGNLSFEYVPTKKTIPAHFLKYPGATYQKGIRVLSAANQIASIELSCPDGAGTVNGFMTREDGNRRIEVYFQYELTGVRRQLEVFSSVIGANTEKFVARMETENGVDYKIWSVKSLDLAGQSFGVAVSGSRQSQKANIRTIKDTDATPDNTVPVDEGILSCVDLNNNQTDDGAAACPIAITDPPKDVKGGDFSINTTSNVVVQTTDQLITDQDIYDFGDLPISSTSTKIIQITNSNADNAINITALNPTPPFSFSGGIFPGTSGGGTCSATLASGSSCTLAIDVDAYFSGEQFGYFELMYDINSPTVQPYVTTIALKANGVSTTGGANLVISELDPYDFGSHALGTTTTKTFTVANTGSAAATGISATSLVDPINFQGGIYPGASGNCLSTLPAGATCEIVLEFSPFVAGVYNSTLTLSYAGNVTTVTKNIIATATATGFLELTDAITGAPYSDFGDLTVGGTAIRTINMTNLGGSPVSTIGFSGSLTNFSFLGGSYPGTGGTCGTTLAGGGSCTLLVSFMPTAVGTIVEPLTLDYNDGAVTSTIVYDLVGFGTSPGILDLDNPNPYSFGGVPVGGSSVATFTLANYGSETITTIAESGLSAPFGYLGGVFPGTGGDCISSLLPGGTCNIVVEYSPTVAGSHTDTFEFMYDNGGTVVSYNLFTISGESGTASLSFTDPTFDFGSMSVGFSASHTFTLQNSGVVDATSLVGLALPTPFSYLGGAFPGSGGTCSSVLAAGSSCTVIVQFAPTSIGTFTDSLDVNYSNGVSTLVVSSSMTGSSTSAAALSIASANPYDFGAVGIGGVVNQIFTVTNVGATPATSMTGSALTAPFSYTGGGYPGSGGTCGAVLPVGSSCTISVSFSPVTIGVVSETLTLNYDDGTVAQSETLGLSGEAMAPASLVISETDPYSYGSVVVGSVESHTFVVTNAGSIDAVSMSEVGLSSPFNFKGGSYPGTGGTCLSTLPAAASCELVIDVNPTSIGTFTGNINLTYHDGAVPTSVSRALTVTSTNVSVLTISETDPYDYGSVIVGSVSSHLYTVTNTGVSDVTSLSTAAFASGFSFTGGFYPGTGGSCSSTLLASSSCTLDVEFSPTTTGPVTGNIVLDYFDGATFQTTTRSMVGTGAGAAVLTISDLNPYDYGTIAIGATQTQTFTIVNSGGVVATGMTGAGLAVPFEFASGGYPGLGGTCSSTLAPGSTCLVVVEFGPVAAGSFTDQFDINYNDGAVAQLESKAVTGTGANLAVLSISDGPNYDFGAVSINTTAVHTFTVVNTGSGAASSIADLGLSAPFGFEGGGTFPGATGTCTATLAASATCEVVIEFTPTIIGSYNDALDLSYSNGINTVSVARNIMGSTSSVALLVISEAEPYDYGTAAVGSVNAHTFTITNAGPGGSVATAMTGTGLSSPFDYEGGGVYPGATGTCVGSLVGGASCTIVVEYSPVVASVDAETLVINYNDGVAVQSVSRGVQGTGANPASIAISDANPYDFGSIATGNTGEHTFTVTNIGGVPATALAGSGLAAPYNFKGASYPGVGGTCSTLLAVSGTCTVVVDFAPVTAGTFTDTIDMNYNNGAIMQLESRDVTGVGL